MDKDDSWRTIDEQRSAVADLLATFTPDEWGTPSLCTGWTVRDVGAHLSIAATMPTGEALRAAVRARGSFDRMIHDTAVERARRPTAEIVADLRRIVGSRRLAPSTLWRDPLLDILVHGEDLSRPVGRTLGRSDPAYAEAARTAADWAWQRRFPFYPARRLRGVRLVAEDVAWARGRGAEVRGPVLALLLLSTGRPAGLADVSGPGVPLLEERMATV